MGLVGVADDMKARSGIPGQESERRWPCGLVLRACEYGTEAFGDQLGLIGAYRRFSLCQFDYKFILGYFVSTDVCRPRLPQPGFHRSALLPATRTARWLCPIAHSTRWAAILHSGIVHKGVDRQYESPLRQRLLPPNKSRLPSLADEIYRGKLPIPVPACQSGSQRQTLYMRRTLPSAEPILFTVTVFLPRPWAV